MNKAKRFALSYGAIILAIFMLRAGLSLFPVDHPQARQSLIQWREVLLLAAMGFALLRLAPRAGFPDLWDERVKPAGRFLAPLGLGAAFAFLTIGESLLHRWPNFHVPFPQSLFVYGSASFLYEVKYHLLPIVLIVWIAYDLELGEKWQRAFFVGAAVLLSLVEPLLQLPAMVKMKMVGAPPWIAASFLKIFLANLVPLLLFRRSGFFALLGFRLATYLLWHVAWPALYF